MFSLLFSGLFFLFLRVSGSGASFPAPLTKEQEIEYFEKMSKGDSKAREILISMQEWNEKLSRLTDE